ncbi:MAG: hypothetical protein ACKVOP_07605 [Sphingomonadaceae bacterium]
MSDAIDAVRAALLRGLGALGCVAIGDGTGGVSTLPRVTVEPAGSSDWSTKTEVGREVTTIVTVRVARGQRADLPGLVAAVEAAGTALGGDIGGWRVASAVFVRTRTADAGDGARVARIEHRVRVLAGF